MILRFQNFFSDSNLNQKPFRLVCSAIDKLNLIILFLIFSCILNKPFFSLKKTRSQEKFIKSFYSSIIIETIWIFQFQKYLKKMRLCTGHNFTLIWSMITFGVSLIKFNQLLSKILRLINFQFFRILTFSIDLVIHQEDCIFQWHWKE